MGLFEQGFSEHRGGREWDSASAVIYQLLGVFEILDEIEFKKFVSKIEKIVKKKIYVEDLMEQFPGGYPRYHLGKYFKKFRTIKKHVVFTEPLNLKKIEDPKKIWPVHIDQNLLLHRK